MKKIVSLFRRNYEGDHLVRDELVHDGRAITRIFVSAQTGEGLDGLRDLLAERYQAFATDPAAYIPETDDPRFAHLAR